MAAYDPDEDLDHDRLRAAIARVQALPRRLPPYQAEQQFFAIVDEVLRPQEWAHGHTEAEQRLAPVLQRLPLSIISRRRLTATDHHPVPLNDYVVGMVEAFVELGLGIEVKRPLGPVLWRLYLDYWQEWSSMVDEEGVDIDDAQDDSPMRRRRRLLRLGLHAAVHGNLFEATAFLARELFAAELAELAPADAIDEVVRWAEANEALNHGKRTALLHQLRAIWNDVLEPVTPTRGLVAIVMDLLPLPDDGTAQRLNDQVRLRRGALRLLCRLGAQVQSWADDVVELPTAWFREAQEEEDIKSILGVCAANYQRRLVQPLVDAGILTLVEEGSRLGHTCARYRFRLDTEGDPLSWEEAEAALGG